MYRWRPSDTAPLGGEWAPIVVSGSRSTVTTAFSGRSAPPAAVPFGTVATGSVPSSTAGPTSVLPWEGLPTSHTARAGQWFGTSAPNAHRALAGQWSGAAAPTVHFPLAGQSSCGVGLASGLPPLWAFPLALRFLFLWYTTRGASGCAEAPPGLPLRRLLLWYTTRGGGWCALGSSLSGERARLRLVHPPPPSEAVGTPTAWLPMRREPSFPLPPSASEAPVLLAPVLLAPGGCLALLMPSSDCFPLASSRPSCPPLREAPVLL